MTDSFELRPLSSAAEREALLEAEFQSFFGFGHPRPVVGGWLDWIGDDNLRVLVQNGQVIGGLGLLPFGQWFGGRVVPSIGISIVAIVPEARGTGAGKYMMQTLVREMAAGGHPLSVLYPSTWAFYRHAGYEPAGARTVYEFNLRRLGALDTSCTMRRIEPGDWSQFAPIYDAFARRQTGLLARTDTNWRKVFRVTEDTLFAYLIEGADGPNGYLVYTHHEVPNKPFQIQIRDVAWLDESAGRRILAFLQQHSILAEPVLYDGPPVDPLLALSRFENQEVRYNHYWMLRVLDARAALAGRGYPDGVSATLHFDFSDDLLPDNAGRFVLRVADGQGAVEEGGDGAIRLGPRGLAPLYTGHLPADEIARMGLLAGDDGALARATTVFSGPRPWIRDRF